MRKMRLMLPGVAVLALATAAAHADLVVGAPVVVPEGMTGAQIEYLGPEADYTGEFYFLGWGDEDGVLEAAGDTGEPGLGQFLFNNQDSPIGSVETLSLDFSEGDVLHFAYNVIAPAGVEDLFRTDNEIDQIQFAWDAGDGTFAVEDIRIPSFWTDYNDAVFQVTFIPAPGAMALLGLAGVLGSRRRR